MSTRVFSAVLWNGQDLPNYSAGQFDSRYIINLWNGVDTYHKDAALVVFVANDMLESVLDDVSEAVGDPVEGSISSKWGSDPYYDFSHPHENQLILVAFDPDDWGEHYLPVLRCVGDYPPIRGWKEGSDPVLVVGLDTVIVNDCTPIFKKGSDIGLPIDPFHRNELCNAVMLLSARGRKLLFGQLESAKLARSFPHMYGKFKSEMVLAVAVARREGEIPLERQPHDLVSYKSDLRSPIDGKVDLKKLRAACIVYFHGKPKPADLDENDPVYLMWVGGQ